MIKAVLLDLDDTLMLSQTNPFFVHYTQLLGEYALEHGFEADFVQRMMRIFVKTLAVYEPSSPLYARFLRLLSADQGVDEARLYEHFTTFYETRYRELQAYVQPRPETPRLLSALFEQGYRVAIATNPGFPLVATSQRMDWGEVPFRDPRIEFVTTLDHMHFGKPAPEYYAEIVLRMGVNPSEAIMVGDSWENDIEGASAAGLHTYWINDEGTPLPDPAISIDGSGTYADFLNYVLQGCLERLPRSEPELHRALLTRLKVFPAAVDTVRRSHNRVELECCPGEDEWSARDIICHLRDHEMLDRERLSRILREDNPFLPANTDPWDHYSEYRGVSFEMAFAEFIERRAQTITCLEVLSDDAWGRVGRDAIFGTTTFAELVSFIIEHDQMHLQQMREAVAFSRDMRRSDPC